METNKMKDFIKYSYEQKFKEKMSLESFEYFCEILIRSYFNAVSKLKNNEISYIEPELLCYENEPARIELIIGIQWLIFAISFYIDENYEVIYEVNLQTSSENNKFETKDIMEFNGYVKGVIDYTVLTNKLITNK